MNAIQILFGENFSVRFEHMSTKTFFTVYGLVIFSTFTAKIDEHFFHNIKTQYFSEEILSWPTMLGGWTCERVFFRELNVHQLLITKLLVFQKVFVDFWANGWKNYKCYVLWIVFVDQIAPQPSCFYGPVTVTVISNKIWLSELELEMGADSLKIGSDRAGIGSRLLKRLRL